MALSDGHGDGTGNMEAVIGVSPGRGRGHLGRGRGGRKIRGSRGCFRGETGASDRSEEGIMAVSEGRGNAEACIGSEGGEISGDGEFRYSREVGNEVQELKRKLAHLEEELNESKKKVKKLQDANLNRI